MKIILSLVLTLLMGSCSSTTQDIPAPNEDNIAETNLKVGERIRVLQHYNNVIFGDHYPGVITEDANVVRVEVKKTAMGTEIYLIAKGQGETRIAYVPVQANDPNDVKRKKDFLKIPERDIRQVKVVK